jgi:hypothetical protein
MNTNSPSPRPQIRGRSRPIRSLLVATGAAFVLTGFILPKADAAVITYFNFEDSTVTPMNVIDINSDQAPANPGGGIVASTLSFGTANVTTGATITNGQPANMSAISPGLPINRTAGDIDVPPATGDFGIVYTRSGANPGDFIQFTINMEFFANVSLSYGFSQNGNGYTTASLFYSINGGAFTANATQPTLNMPTGLQPAASFTLDSAVNGNGMAVKNVTFRIVFSGGQSNGNDDQSVIDNILLGGTVIPEPATVVGGLLGVCALCWHQRRRLIGFLPLRRA